MGFKDWWARKIATTKLKNDAKAEAEAEYYNSAEYKKTFAKAESKKITEGKTNSTSDWLKRISQNAARNLNAESITIDKEKLFGEKKKKE